MVWQTIDFKGAVSLDKSIHDQLQHYLEGRESHLSQLIANLVSSSPQAPFLSDSLHGGKARLKDGIEIFEKKIDQVEKNSGQAFSSKQWEGMIERLNDALWEYVELLEGAAVELLQQLKHVGLELWSLDLVKTVESIKELLSQRILSLKKGIERLETYLWKYRFSFEKHSKVRTFLLKATSLWKSAIDKEITNNLDKTQKFLNFNQLKFTDQYAQYAEISEKIDKSLAKFLNYRVFNALETEDSSAFKSLYRLLKLWNQNKQIKAVPNREIFRSVGKVVTPERAPQLFRRYYKGLQSGLFEESHRIKKDPSIVVEPKKKTELQQSLTVHRLELHSLSATVASYREFLNESDPNPYVGRSDEWGPGAEPFQSQNLTNLQYDIEALDALSLKFSDSLQKETAQTAEDEKDLQEEIQKTLHEMGPPLASRSMMYVRAERLVHQLEQLDELSSTDPEIIDFFTQTLSKAMRLDWKYHVLQEISSFKELYGIHLGLLGTLDDRNHLKRMHKFQHLIQQLEGWIKAKTILKHQHEIELDMNDIKGYLQDFLAQVQRIEKDPSIFSKVTAEKVIREISQQLLEYRYLFGKFFHQLSDKDSDELMRQQFLFVDLYFESIESKLIEMRSVNWQENVENVPEQE